MQIIFVIGVINVDRPCPHCRLLFDLRKGVQRLGTAERRNAILRILCRRRHETVRNLASELGVSERTIRRDIEVLSYTEPIYTQTGRYGGGVYVVDGYSMDRMYITPEEEKVLHKLRELARQQCLLTTQELNTFTNLIKNYTKPSYLKRSSL